MPHMKAPIFVLGTQRSGTTLLCRMLSAHPDIFIEDVLQYSHKPSFYHRTLENQNTYRNPDIKLAKKWREEFSSRKKNIVEIIAGTMLSKLDYPVSGMKYKIGGFEKAYFLANQKIIGEIQIQYRWRFSMIREYFRKKALNK